MEDRDTEIEKLKKELANLKKDPRELILASRIREREEEYQHRLLELELASEGIIPIGIAHVYYVLFDNFLRGLYKNFLSVFANE